VLSLLSLLMSLLVSLLVVEIPFGGGVVVLDCVKRRPAVAGTGSGSRAI
jgi:hypothetical protein